MTKRSRIKAMSVVPQSWYHNKVFPVRFWRHRKLLKHDSINRLFRTTTWIHIVQLKHNKIVFVFLKYDLNLSLNNYIICMYMLWFNFILGSNFIFLCFKLIIIHYNTQKHKKRKFEPRIKLNHNICIQYMILYYIIYIIK